MNRFSPQKRHADKVLISAGRIKRKVKALADKISRDYKGKELTIVSVLKGSVIFFSDLIRRLKLNCSVDFIAVSSYQGISSFGRARFLADLKEDPAGKNILLVEGIVDSGFTLNYLKKNLIDRKAAAVRICALLDKKAARKIPVKVDYRGFVIPDEFVVGYGLDYNEQYRGLPYIGVLKANSLKVPK
jgi:hypoxanthine phosphoribosyltransferase